jgi:hypothetical protein
LNIAAIGRNIATSLEIKNEKRLADFDKFAAQRISLIEAALPHAQSIPRFRKW